MKTIDEIKLIYGSNALEGRSVICIIPFMTKEDMIYFHLNIENELKPDRIAIPFTKHNILKQLEKDVAYGFEKAFDQRGISASFAADTVMMWNWILEEGLEDFDLRNNYAQYGLPLFKATAIKYGFDNPIGDDIGNEPCYSAEEYEYWHSEASIEDLQRHNTY